MGVVGTILSWEGCTRAHPHLTHSHLRGSESGQDTWLETPSVSTHRPHHSSVPCHMVTAAKKGGLLAHPQGSCHHPPFWCCKGTWPPPGSRQLPLISPMGRSYDTAPCYQQYPECCLYFFKKGIFTVSSSEAALAAADNLSRPQQHPHHGSPSRPGPWTWLGKGSYPDSREGSPSPFPKARV